MVKPDKLGEWAAWWKKANAFAKERPDLFKEIKSVKVFRQRIGDIGVFVEMYEMESLADVESWMQRAAADKDRTTKILPEIMAIIVPGTLSMSIWSLEYEEP
jgi:antibiotic biosynthesis monooxygenase (ABM) superfamily enzyme